MKVTVFSSKPYDREFLPAACGERHELVFFENRLRAETAALAQGSQAVCAFVNDELDQACLAALIEQDVRCIALRCAGFNNVDLAAAARMGVRVARVPAYSPHAVAEHAMAQLLCLNRHLHKAHNRVREGNFSLNGLLGFDLHGKTVGVIGTGMIGEVFCRIALGFGCKVIAFDPIEDEGLVAAGVRYVSLDGLFGESEIISLHCPLMKQTHHLIDAAALAKCRDGLVLVNTSRGGLVDTRALIDALKSGKLGGVALDVYEEEAGVFFEDLSGQLIDDDLLMRLTTFPNVLITAHQGFFTREAMEGIAATTASNLDELELGGEVANEVLPVR